MDYPSKHIRKLPAKKIVAILATMVLCLIFSSATFAEDLGWPVTFKHSPRLSISPDQNSGKKTVLYDSGPSNPIKRAWDTALISGSGATPELSFQISRSEAKNQWSAWKVAPLHVSQDGRFWTKATLNRSPGALRVRVLGKTLPHAFKILEIAVFHASPESGGQVSNNLRVSFQLPQNSVWPRPLIHSRKEWHARKPTNPYDPSSPQYITIHHTSGIQTYSLAKTLREVRFVQDFQMDGRGWWDIGYHFLIDASGNIIEGRPENVQGSHTKGFNVNNLGIALLGDYNPPVNDRVTPKQMDALIALIRYLSSKYNIPSSAIKGHRDYDQTACPGSDAYALLPALRALNSQAYPLNFHPAIIAAEVLTQPIHWDSAR